MSEVKLPPGSATIEAKLGHLEWRKAATSHIHLVNSSQDAPCVSRCRDKPCATVCPAKVYEWDASGGKVLVAYENCIECGACRMICPFDNIKCDWPVGGFGVKYKYG